jgi:hypothetical protein
LFASSLGSPRGAVPFGARALALCMVGRGVDEKAVVATLDVLGRTGTPLALFGHRVVTGSLSLCQRPPRPSSTGCTGSA